MLSWQNCSGDVVQPYLMSSNRTGCGFFFIPVPKKFDSDWRKALLNLTTLAKHLLHVDRCVGVTFRRDGEYRLLDWAVLLHPWEANAELDAVLEARSPFRKTLVDAVPRYTFK